MEISQLYAAPIQPSVWTVKSPGRYRIPFLQLERDAYSVPSGCRTPLRVRGPSTGCNGRAASAHGAFLALPCSLGFRLASSATGSARLPQFAMVALRRPMGPSWRSLAHWASASFHLPPAALGSAPRMLSSDLATQGELSRRDKRRPPGGCAANPIIASGGCGLRTPGGFSTG